MAQNLVPVGNPSQAPALQCGPDSRRPGTMATGARLRFETDPIPDDLRRRASELQEDTRALMRPLSEQVAAMKEQANQQGGGGPPGGGGGGGLPPEVIELAQKNLPLAESAMGQGLQALGGERYAEAHRDQKEAHRLLEEILKKLDEQQKDDQDKKQQQQQQQQGESQPKPRNLSEDEMRRLAKSVQERQKNAPKPPTRPRAPVEEDW